MDEVVIGRVRKPSKLLLSWGGVLLLCAASCAVSGCDTNKGDRSGSPERIFQVRGFIHEIQAEGRKLLIKHEEVPGYMPAMTMPFQVRETNLPTPVELGMEITFRLHVTDEVSWIDQVKPTGAKAVVRTEASQPAASTPTAKHPLLAYQFTNEWNQPVSFNDFKGSVLVYTFFFTRCPIPEYCPRLSKNFQEACAKLSALPNAPTNWHFVSVSFDSQFDTPAVLRSYAQSYQYDSNHWSFLTGPPDKIAELARLSDVSFSPDGTLFNHGFRTLLIDPAGRLQMSYPIGGNLSQALVEDVLKLAASK